MSSRQAEQEAESARRDRMLAMTGEARRDEILPSQSYYSQDFLQLEKTRLWPHVWQQACREEELSRVGDFVEYAIHDQSVIVVRAAPDRIRAFHNVCQHRARRLVSGVGHVSEFRCMYHGWRYGLDGRCSEITDSSDFVSLCPKDVFLPEIRTGLWAGWVYVNFDAGAESLEDFLDPVPQFLDPFEIGKMRFAWYKSALLPANWKTVMDGFLEGYHVPTTHPQNVEYFDYRNVSFRRGKHSNQNYAPDSGGFAVPNRKLAGSESKDPRALLKEYMETRKTELDAIFTSRHVQAANEMMALPEDTPPKEVMDRFRARVVELAREDGYGNTTITLEQLGRAGWGWHVFPNQVILPSADGVLAYRFRPNGDDPNTSLMDIFSLARFAEGREPPIHREYFANWRDGDWGRVLMQDFSNFEQVQRGVKSAGLAGLRINPLQESSIANYHRVIAEYLERHVGK